ncbi:type VII secretion protein EccE [Mycobacterium sp. 1423905.2]|uniref:type VII secretion protein EccE n=1 Tax=Mycobacterium sp. 1423905.2 TaxID=1856859 RepID=UPI0007FF9AB7|nr:type VII secretion protein EccE [Mycobacterium sp. 1423905.2]OBJ53377.1 type VII secretion protein EccE [Mycobacterium sp. 1423905.2]
MSRSIAAPGTGRITLALLAVVPAVLAYPWHTTRDYWLVGIAVAVVVVLFGWWKGLHWTTLLRRRLAIMGGRRSAPAADTRITAVVRIGAPPSGTDVLPLPLLARYLNCYGVRADTIRITNRHTGSGAVQTWVGLTVDAADNLAALQARSPRIPLQETAQVAARRLADHLRELGWDANPVPPDEVPALLAPGAHESWSVVRQGDSNYLAAYRVSIDDALPERLAAIREHKANQTWTALEIAAAARSAGQYTLAAACAFRTDTPGGALALTGVTPQRGNQLPALRALTPLATQRLDGHTAVPADVLTGLDWPTPSAGSHRAPLTEAASRT